MSSLRLYEQPVPNGRESFTIAEDDEHFYDLVPMLFNHRLVITPKESLYRWVWGWCFDGPVEAILAMRVWDPETQNEPVGWKKRPTSLTVRQAPRADEDPEHNRHRCIHGDYPDDGPCTKAQYCHLDMQRLEEEKNRPTSTGFDDALILAGLDIVMRELEERRNEGGEA